MPADRGHDEGFFGERVASVYDEHAADMFDPAVVTPVVDLLAGLAGRGGALELGIGTGRIALPLAERGVRVAGEFSLVYLISNTIFNLVTQDAQVACFENAAAHLGSGGRFVIETGVPDLQNLAVGRTVIPVRADPGGMGFDVYDVVTQRFSSQHYDFVDGRVEAHPVEFRYAWPAELDLMARLAGLSLRDRWANWRREPFTGLSRGHVSVYQKP